ncbi:MAG: DUF5666 domain-containing protein [bacterium]|nr:DUF5666 domain-containing protein [bacterium]
MDFNKFFSAIDGLVSGGQSKKFKIALIVLGALIVLLAAFRAGEFVGYKKARFSYMWGENYHRNFAGPRGGFFGDVRRGFEDGDFISAHGTFGSVISIDGSTLVIKGEGDVEKTILVSDKTMIESRREPLRISGLRVDDRVVVIGSPDEQGRIEAKLIRVFR